MIEIRKSIYNPSDAMKIMNTDTQCEDDDGTPPVTSCTTTVPPAPMMYMDFDGVFNAFPDSKVLRRGGQSKLHEWAKPEDPRSTLYDTNNAFLLDGNDRIRIPDGSFRIHWSTELADAIIQMQNDNVIELSWLSTWQPYTSKINDLFGWDDDLINTVTWYDETTKHGLATGKLDTILARISDDARSSNPQPVIWVDDEEVDDYSINRIVTAMPANERLRVLLVKPDYHIGLSRKQVDLIQEFVSDPDSFDTLTINVEPSLITPVGRERFSGHRGF